MTSAAPTVQPDADLVAHVAAGSGLTTAEAQRLVTDVISYYAEPVEDYVVRRHRALKLRGMRNDEIFEQVAAELSTRVVAAPSLSTRQLRRMIYG